MPINITSQNIQIGTPFPAWRLPNGINKASDSDLERSASSFETWAIISGLLVVFGLIVEAVIAFVHPAYDSLAGTWAPFTADVLVAIGVAGEVLFSMMSSRRHDELRIRSNTKLADAIVQAGEANQKAEEAQLARIELEAQFAPRELTKDQYEELQILKGQVSAVNITSSSTFEAARFAAQLAQALIIIGIDAKVCDQRIGMVWTEIYVVIPTPIPDFSKDPLYAAFKKAGLSVGCGDRSHVPMADLPVDVPVIMVGEKAPPSQWPPYVFTLPPKTNEIGQIVK